MLHREKDDELALLISLGVLFSSVPLFAIMLYIHGNLHIENVIKNVFK